MNTVLYLLWGVTSMGKTSYSVMLAKKYGLPVIALDRFQGYPEIMTGSGAPDHSELQGTERIYITPSRNLIEKVVSPEEAHHILKQKTSISLAKHPSIIIEGGSVSLLKNMISDYYWTSFSWRIKKFLIPSQKDFIERAKKRVSMMVYPKNDRPSILQETSIFFRKHHTVEPLADIDGYRIIIQYCKENNINYDSLDKLPDHEKDNITNLITHEYYEHALWQEKSFPGFPPSWSWVMLQD
ncbi:isopentenyl transferase [Dickeya sp. CFBP 2040]|uniref:Isopentenyl transferase n=1 Tax=Dickeya poaceiphila TaxID=568768 RepID=A0A5B8IBY5_9GAMM|nr:MULTISPECIES: isopentenyl transferase family protein [Dickeya]NKI76075.1 isopentenyl transferase [Dickeya sp. CFBP 2040]QDX31553.1 isopentenyl transferase [Dickeya poaceiphila]